MITDNEWVKKTPVKQALEALQKTVATYGSRRHLFVHRGELPDVKSTTDSEILDILELHSTVHRLAEPVVPIDMLDLVYQDESNKIVARLDADVVEAKKRVSSLFDALLPIYQKVTGEQNRY